MKRENIHKDLKHQGWEQLSIVLDKEMPVKKNRKGFVIFGVMLLFISTITIIGLWDKITTEPNLIITENIVNYKNTNVEKVHENNAKKASKGLMKTSLEENISTERKPAIQKPSKNKRSIKNDFVNIQKTKSSTIAKIEDFGTNIESINNNRDLKFNDNSVAFSQIVSNLSTLKPIDVWKINLKHNLTFNNSTIILNHRHRRILNPFIEVETYVYNDVICSKPKFNLKIGNQFSLNNRLSLNLDVGLMQSELVADDVFEYISPPFADISLNGGYSNYSTVEYKRLLIDGNNFRNSIVNSSLNLGYRVNRKLNFNIGGGIIYTKMIKYTFDNNKSNFDNRTNYSEAYRYYENSIKDFTYFSNMEFSYYILDKFNLSIGFKQFFTITGNKKQAIYSKNKIVLDKQQVYFGIKYSIFN